MFYKYVSNDTYTFTQSLQKFKIFKNLLIHSLCSKNK